MTPAETTHEGADPSHGGITTHRGTRENCAGPDCGPDRGFTTSEISAELVKSAATDSDVLWSARVSTLGETSLADQYSGELAPRDRGLINFLMRDRHGTPFEHNSMTFLIKAPMMVFWQMVRHRVGWSYNLESGRYRELGLEFYSPDRDRPLRQVGKPGAYEYVPGTDYQQRLMWHELETSYGQAWDSYQRMLTAGIAREVARLVLPFGVYFHGYATCNARSLMHFLSLRTKDEGATVVSSPQHEINVVANQMEAEWARLMPETHAAFIRNGRVAP